VARETITRLIDDLDGGEAAETVAFGLDGLYYQIDLSAKNANRLRSALATYVEHGSRVSGRAAGGARRVARRRAVAAADASQNQAIRAWAQRRGLEVAPRGRIRREVVEAYNKRAGR
jgi:hypothetical protein